MNLRPKFREEHVTAIESFIAHHLKESDRKGLVLGISGGLDSAVVAKLCSNAVGPSKVLGLMLHDNVTADGDRKDARSFARTLDIGYREVDITPVIDSFKRSLKLKAAQKIAIGNIKARSRMTILYNVAALENRLVIGTGNKSEIACGYFTKFGDGGADFMPLGDLYKTQVREMATFLDVPKRIVEKAPAAGLWKGQTDEDELGIAYSDLDRILLGLELQFDDDVIARKTGLSPVEIAKVRRHVDSSIHKRKMPLIPKLGIRTFGLDWRE